MGNKKIVHDTKQDHRPGTKLLIPLSIFILPSLFSFFPVVLLSSSSIDTGGCFFFRTIANEVILWLRQWWLLLLRRRRGGWRIQRCGGWSSTTTNRRREDDNAMRPYHRDGMKKRGDEHQAQHHRSLCRSGQHRLFDCRIFLGSLLLYYTTWCVCLPCDVWDVLFCSKRSVKQISFFFFNCAGIHCASVRALFTGTVVYMNKIAYSFLYR